MSFWARVAALLVSCLMLSIVFASLSIVPASTSGEPALVEMENPVLITDIGPPHASAVTRSFSPPDYGGFRSWIENSGLRSLTIDVRDNTTGLSIEVMHIRIRFSQYGAYPSGMARVPDIALAKGRTYEFTFTPSGPKGATALYFHSYRYSPPVAIFTYATDFYLGVTVDASASYDVDGVIVNYSWNWGDSSPDGFGVIAHHTYPVFGTYMITLTVTDDDSFTGSMAQTINLYPPPAPPVPVMTLSARGLNVTADGSASYDPDGVIVQYIWTWGDGSPSGSGAVSSHDYPAAGTYTLTLTIVDNDGNSASTSKTLTLAAPLPNAPPLAIFSLTSNYLTRTVAVDASSSYDPDGYITSYQWDWGDGSSYAMGAAASHNYSSDGPWWVMLTVTDNGGLEGWANELVWFGPPTEPDLYVVGTTYAADGSILIGCNLTVEDLNSGEVIHTFSNGVDGMFQVMLGFGTLRVQIGDIVQVTATKGDLSGTNSAIAEYVGLASLWIDVYLA